MGAPENVRASKPIITEKEVKTTEEVRKKIIVKIWRLSDLNDIIFVMITCGIVILTELTYFYVMISIVILKIFANEILQRYHDSGNEVLHRIVET